MLKFARMAPPLEVVATPLEVPGHRPQRSEVRHPSRSQGTNFETKIFKFRCVFGLSHQNELYHILWDDLSTRVVTISIIILELFNKENEKVLIGNIYFVLGTPSAAKFEQVPSNNTPAYLRHFVTLIWQDDGDYEQRQLLLISRERQFFSHSCSSL